MADPFHFDRSWRLEVGRQELWWTLAETGEYQRWWSWLRTFNAPPLQRGAVATATIGPPLPYALRVRIQLTDVQPARRVTGSVTGDLEGTASLELTDADDTAAATTARLTWTLVLRHRVLVPAAGLLRPLLEWGHNWVVDAGVEQFRLHGLDETRRAEPTPQPLPHPLPASGKQGVRRETR